MSLELSSIAFKVETKELDIAVQKLGDLQKAVTNLNKPIASTTLATEKLAQAQAKTALTQAKAEEAANKAALVQAKLEKATTSNAAAQAKLEEAAKKTALAQAKLANSTADSTDKVSALQQKLENTYKDLAQGFTKGESSVLNYARTLGVAGDALKPIQDQLKQIGKLTSDPFDSAIGSIRSITKEFEMMNHRSELASKGIILTAKQLKEYSRVADEVSAKIQSQGFDPTSGKGLSDYTKGVERLQSKYLGVASAVSEAQQAEKLHQQTLKESAKAAAEAERLAQVAPDAHVLQFYKKQEQSANSAAKATNYLEREMQRAENALAGLNENMLISSSNRLLKFKEGLAASGMASDEAAKRYAAYAKVISDTDAKRKTQQASDEQARINNLSRGLAPQISDVAVSLYGGMSPMTVLMQQGLQVRDLIQSSGVEADKLNEVLKKTGSDFLGTLSGTFKAVGSLVVGVFQSAGVSTAKFIGDVTGLSGAFEYLRYQVALMEKDTDKVTSVLGKFGSVVLNSAIPMIATGLAGLAIAAVTAAVALKQLIAEESNFSKVLNLNGAALGLNRDAAYSLATTYAGARGDIDSYVVAMTESAKAGNISSDSLKTVTDSAVYMKTVAGVAIEDTVKQFSELAKDPVKAIEKVAISLGTIDPEIVKVVRNLKDQGKEAEAAAIATTAYAEGLAKAGAMIKSDMGFLESFFKTIGSAASSMWDKILNVGREGTLQQQIDSAKEKIRSISAGEGVFILSDRNVTLGIEKARLEGLEKELDLQKRVNDQKQRNVELIKSDSEIDALLDKYKVKSDKKADAITKVNNLFAENIRLAKESGKATDEIEANHKLVLAGIEEKFKVRAKKDPVETAYQQAISVFTKDANAATAAQEQYTKAQQDFLNVATSPAWNKFSLDQKQNIVSLAEEAIAREKVVEQAKEELKVQLELQKTWDKTIKAQTDLDKKDFDSLAKSDAKLALLDEELADLILQKSIFGDLSVEQKKQIEYAKIKRDLTKEIADIELRVSQKNLSPDAALIEKNNAYLGAAKKRQNIDQAIILENKKYEYQQRVELAAGISSSIESALYEGGQAGSKKLRSVIEAELRKPITLFIQAVVQDIFGLNGASDTMTKAVGAFDKVMNVLSGTTGTNIGAQLSGTLQRGADWMATSSNNTIAGAGDYLGKYAQGIGSYAGMAGNALAGYGISKTISGGYKTGLGNTVDTVGAIASAIPGGVGQVVGPIAGVISGLVNRSFGRKLTETGIEGTFGGSQGFTGNQYTFEKGGWFRSDRTKISALDTGVQEGFAGQFNTLRAGIALMSTSLGLGTKSIEDFTYKFKLNLMGLSEADATKKIKEEFDKVGLAIADTIPQLKEYQKQGETNLDTLTRLSTSLGTVNSTFELLGFKLEDLSLSGAKAADAIITAYGSLEVFSSKMQAYYDGFYTEEEKKAQVLSGISTALKKAGVDVGDVSTLTRDGFRAIVDNLVKTKGAADPAVVALLSVAPAFAGVTKSTDQLIADTKQAAIDATEAAIKAQETARKAQEDELKRQQDLADAAEKAAKEAQSIVEKTMNDFNAKVKSFFSDFRNSLSDITSVLDSASNSINDFIAGLVSQVSGPSGLIQVRQQFERNLTKAQAGDREALSGITGSAGTLIESIKSNAGSAAEAALGQARVVQQLLKLPSQVKPEELIVNAIQKQTFELASSITKDFTSIDKNIDGLLTFDELKAAGIATDGQIGNLIAAVDSNADGNISAMEAMTATLSARFASIDVNVSGTIDYNEFRNTFAGLGSESTLRSIFSELDTNGDGTISRLEAIKVTSADTAENTYGLDKLARIRDVVNSLQWGTPQADAISTPALGMIAKQNNWSTYDIADALGFVTAPDVQSFFDQYGVSGVSTSFKPSNTLSPEQTIARKQAAIKATIESQDWSTTGSKQSSINLYNSSMRNGWRQIDIADVLGWTVYDVQQYMQQSAGIPAYANGGAFTNGVVSKPTFFNSSLMGEKGSEAIMPLTNVGGKLGVHAVGSGDSSEVVNAINELNSNIDLLRYEMQTTAVNTGKTERLLNRVTNYGESMQVTTTV